MRSASGAPSVSRSLVALGMTGVGGDGRRTRPLLKGAEASGVVLGPGQPVPPPPPPHIHQKIVSFAESVISGRGPLGSPSTACLNIDPRPGAKTFGGLEGGGLGEGYMGRPVNRRGPPGGGGVSGYPNIHASK